MFATAFSPSGISSFFEICNQKKDGGVLKDPAKIGARGGGFALSKGVTTKVFVEESKITEIEVFINHKQTKRAKTTETTVNMILKSLKQQHKIHVEHLVDVPISAGFGTSAAGSFSCGLALSHALRLPLTYNQIATIAHIADVICQTGLGTVEGLAVGGLALVLKSGAMGIGFVDRIILEPDVKIVAGVFKSINKKSVLQSRDITKNINKIAKQTMKQILAKPTPVNFMKCCKEFAYNSGLASKRIKKLIEEAEEAGAIGAAQNMIGEAVHALTTKERVNDVYKIFTKFLPNKNIIISNIDFQGARLQ